VTSQRFVRSEQQRSQDFCPLPILVDSTRRKSLIRWQKRAAMWKHGFESWWGHQPKYQLFTDELVLVPSRFCVHRVRDDVL